MQKINVSCNALNGNKDATERVVRRLQREIGNTGVKSEASVFWELRDQLIAAELGNSKTPSGVVPTCTACYTQSTESLAQTAAKDTTGSAVVASDAAAPSSWGICEPLVPSPAMPPSPAAAAVHMKATLKVFVEQTAAGHKFWECSVRSGMFNRVRAGDLLILTQTESKGMVVAVGEIANGPIHRESRRETLYSRIPLHLRRSVEEYLGTATAFDYVQFSQVFDVRRHRMSFREILAKGLFEDPCLPWCNGLLTAKKTPASSMVGLRDFLATHGTRRVCQDGVDVD